MGPSGQHKMKDEILDFSLSNADKYSWLSDEMLVAASKAMGLDFDTVKLCFPTPLYIMDYYSKKLDMAMMTKLNSIDTESMSVTNRIKLALSTRIVLQSDYKEAMRSFLSFFSCPKHMLHATKLIWRASDVIWYNVANDGSTDFNHYTKRAMLASIYMMALIMWADSDSDDFSQVEDFISHRVDEVVTMGKGIGRVKNKVDEIRTKVPV